MSGAALRNVTKRIAEVARKTAIQQSPIIEGTVVGRNPDGSLVVDDGRGGCRRVAPKANVRIGERIRLGTEPSLGHQTNLPQVFVTIDPSTTPCPDDGRGCVDMVGTDCPPLSAGDFSEVGTRYSLLWSSLDFFEAWPGTQPAWSTRAGPSAGALYINSFPRLGAGGSRRASNYPSHVLTPYADQVTLVAARVFLSFDTTTLPPGGSIQSAVLTLPIKGNVATRMRADLNQTLYVVPSSWDGTVSAANWDLFDFKALGGARIIDIINAGPFPLDDTEYFYELALGDPIGGSLENHITRGGTTRLMLMVGRDYEGTTQLAPPSFTNLSNPNEVRDYLDFLTLTLTVNATLSVTFGDVIS